MAEKLDELCTHDIVARGSSFWRPIFLSGTSLEELHKVLTAESLRRMRLYFPQNLALLIVVCMEQMRHYAAEVESTPLDFRSAACSLRIITRIMPVLFEGIAINPEMPPHSDAGVDFVRHFFWENKAMLAHDPARTFTELAGEALTRPLGVMLMETLLDLAQCPHGCVNRQRSQAYPEREESHPDIAVRNLWYGGLGPVSAQQLPSYSALDNNRLDVVRCILACCTGPMFQEDPLAQDKFIEAFAASDKAVATKTFIYSLLNCVAPYDPAGMLPYTSYMTDAKEPLMDNALHLLLILLDNGTLCRERLARAALEESDGGGDGLGGVGSEPLFAESKHVVWQAVTTLTEKADMETLFNSFVRLLSNPMQARRTWLPGSQKMMENAPEVLGLLWKVLDSNDVFRKHLCRELPVCRLVVPLLYHMWQARTNRECVTTMQVGLWIMLLLSGERDFAVALNEEMTEVPQYDLATSFRGTYLDLVIITFQQLVQSGVEWVRMATDGFLTAIANLSPYIKSMSMVTASKLLNLFDALSTRKFLTSSRDNWRCLDLLFQAYNNVIQYQYEGNLVFVYSILRREPSFRQLAESLAGEGDSPIEAEWAGEIPTYTVIRMLDVLYPQMGHEGAIVDEVEMMSFLQRTTLVGLLPPPHSITIRSYFATPQIYSYISTWVWGLLYNRHHTPPMFAPERVRLFPIISEAEDGKLTTLGSGTQRERLAPDGTLPPQAHHHPPVSVAQPPRAPPTEAVCSPNHVALASPMPPPPPPPAAAEVPVAAAVPAVAAEVLPVAAVEAAAQATQPVEPSKKAAESAAAATVVVAPQQQGLTIPRSEGRVPNGVGSVDPVLTKKLNELSVCSTLRISPCCLLDFLLSTSILRRTGTEAGTGDARGHAARTLRVRAKGIGARRLQSVPARHQQTSHDHNLIHTHTHIPLRACAKTPRNRSGAAPRNLTVAKPFAQNIEAAHSLVGRHVPPPLHLPSPSTAKNGALFATRVVTHTTHDPRPRALGTMAKAGKGKPKEKSEDEQLLEGEETLVDLGREVWQLERRLVIEAEKYQRYKLVQLDLKREIAQLGEQMESEERLTQHTRIDMYRQYKAMQHELCHRIDLLQQTIDSLREELETQRRALEQTKQAKDEVIAQKNKVCTRGQACLAPAQRIRVCRPALPPHTISTHPRTHPQKINEQKQQMENMAIVFGNMLKETLEHMSQRMDGQGAARGK